MSNLPAPRYTFWEAITASLALAQRAIDEVRALAARPPVVGPQGKNGKDGMGFDDMKIEHDGERTITMVFRKGEQVREFQMKLPIPIYRELWIAGRDYERGDTVTWDGSLWSALMETKTQPGTSPAWRMAAKRGRAGRNTETVKLIPPVSIKKPDESDKD